VVEIAVLASRTRRTRKNTEVVERIVICIDSMNLIIAQDLGWGLVGIYWTQKFSHMKNRLRELGVDLKSAAEKIAEGMSRIFGISAGGSNTSLEQIDSVFRPWVRVQDSSGTLELWKTYCERTNGSSAIKM
jgi:hypothetical protein